MKEIGGEGMRGGGGRGEGWKEKMSEKEPPLPSYVEVEVDNKG